MKRKPIYLYLSLLTFTLGMFTTMIPVMELLVDPKSGDIKIFNPTFNFYQVLFLSISVFISGVTLAFLSLKFSTNDYWMLEKEEKKSHLKIVK